jgi:choline-sulfatase
MSKRRGKRNDRRAEEGVVSRDRSKRRICLLLGSAALILVVALSANLFWSKSGDGGWPEGLVRGSASGANVLLITLDTTRADRLGCYGHKGVETPNLDALAAGGIRFDDAVTVVPVTLPAHTTIMTGVDPPTHGVRHNGEYRLEAGRATLAEVLAGAGYETAAFVSAFVLDARFGLSRGFSVYDDDVGVSASSVTDFSRPIYERSATAVTDRAIAWFKGHDSSKPFFSWVHYFDPHAPRQPPSPFASRFAGRLYDGEIAYMDSQIGRLLRALDKAGAIENTLIIVVADHGESLGEHDEATHAKLIYESTMHVPLILSYPKRINRGHVVDAVVVSIADVMPTVLELVGVSHDGEFDGVSLLAGRLDRKRMIYMETLAPYLDSGWSPLYGIRRHQDKYILAPTPEYYNLGVDPHELDNLFTEPSELAASSRNLLVAELSSRMVGLPSLAAAAASAKKLDPDAQRQLESLGYVGSIPDADTPGDELADPKEMMAVLQAIDEAEGLATAGRTDEAFVIITGVVSEFPRDPKALVALGKVYLHQDRREKAEEVLRKAHAIRPSARVCILLAQLMIAGQRIDEAANFLDQAEVLEPLHGGIYLARGDWLTMQGRPLEAIASYEHAKEVDPYRTAREAELRIAKLRAFMRKLEEQGQ